ncbi:MAG: sigma-70 family RNA polymerase sigma factor [Prevotella sp.]|nr:sigma-70 family RNA polymerase sigma factor [Prevotella sp.]
MTEKEKFAPVYRQYYQQLYLFATRYVSDREECHDIISGAFEELWRNFDHVDLSSVKRYLYVSVKNRCIDLLRRKVKQDRYIEYVGVMAKDYIDEQRYEQSEYRSAVVRKVLDSLVSPDREILIACYIEEKKYREVAEEMGISVSMVRKHMMIALKKVRQMKESFKKSDLFLFFFVLS